MRKLWLVFMFALFLATSAKDNKSAYYGTNYTVPFAHAYRALSVLGVDHKAAIDRDVYHFSRLGLNAFRLHLWDVELTDSAGNLMENEHLDLLDYLVDQLEQRGIAVVLTAQTNFGNGYPERNTDPYGAYSYRYDKCRVHDIPEAQDAQQHYLQALVRHVNSYNGLSYADDPSILAIEINNEPCHSGTTKEITEYIDRMARAIKKAGWKKDILYNVSHNLDRTQAFYDARIDGTTYQWYPLNLVSGHTRRGNFLPFVDQYDIPFKNVRGYDKRTRMAYEFDPADNLLSYLYPAIARTLRKEGFWWMTQFAYDPIDMAWANSEYQTHYLNLAYTPRKALGMMIAAEAARQIPAGADFGKYPADTVFGNFMVSAVRDLAMLNDARHYYHTNNTGEKPVSPATIEHIAGWGTSPLVAYKGTGAYFLDKIEPGLWRLEVMPDVVLTSDPFAKPSLSKRVGEIIYGRHTMEISLPDLGKDFAARSLADNQVSPGETLMVSPGVYILGDSVRIMSVDPSAAYADGHRRICEYVAPGARPVPSTLVHIPEKIACKEAGIDIKANIVGDTAPDSVLVYPSTVSFWNDHNNVYIMQPTGEAYEYSVNISQWRRGMPYQRGKNPHPQAPLGEHFTDYFSYNIVVYRDGVATTYPAGTEGAPLDWDYIAGNPPCYTVRMIESDDKVPLLMATPDLDGSEISTIPTDWNGVGWDFVSGQPYAADHLRARKADDNHSDLIVTKYIGDINPLHDCGWLTRQTVLEVVFPDIDNPMPTEVCLVNTDGFTYGYTIERPTGIIEIPLQAMTLRATPLCPEPYPAFMAREFVPDPDSATPLDVERLEKLVLINPGTVCGVSILTK